MDAIAEAYSAAFTKLNGYAPTVTAVGKRYHVRTALSEGREGCDYTARDLRLLTAALERLAK